MDISRAYWSRRTGVKAAELLRPASQNSRSSRNSFRSGALIPARALSRPGPFLRRPPGRVPSPMLSSPRPGTLQQAKRLFTNPVGLSTDLKSDSKGRALMLWIISSDCSSDHRSHEFCECRRRAREPIWQSKWDSSRVRGIAQRERTHCSS